MASGPSAVLFGTHRISVTTGRPLFGDSSLIGAHVAALRRAGVEQIALVAGSGSGTAAAKEKDVRVVLHSGAWNSAFDEIVLGLFALDTAPVLVLPIEHEVVGDETLAQLVGEAESGTASHAVVPVHGLQTGYPIVLFRAGVDAIIKEAANPSGQRRFDAIIQSWRDGVRSLTVADDTVLNELSARA